MTIAILTPTKGRPAQFRRMVESVEATTDTPVVVEMGYTLGDVSYGLHQYDRTQVVTTTFPDGLPTVYKWNYLADFAFKNPDIRLFMLGADDMIFATPGWERALLDHYNKLEEKIHVYSLQDSRDKEGTPHIIVTREYIEAMGFFLPPIFLHWMIDTWTADIAKRNNIFTYMTDYLLVHDKLSDKGQPDETHKGIRGMGWRERDQQVDKQCARYKEVLRDQLRMAIENKYRSAWCRNNGLDAVHA